MRTGVVCGLMSRAGRGAGSLLLLLLRLNLGACGHLKSKWVMLLTEYAAVSVPRCFDAHWAPFPRPKPLLAPPSPPAMPDNRPYPVTPTTPAPPKASSAQRMAAFRRAWWCCTSTPYTTSPAEGASGVCGCHLSLPAPMCCADPGDGNSGLTRRTAPPATATQPAPNRRGWHVPLSCGMVRRR